MILSSLMLTVALPVAVYSEPMNPRAHPDDVRRAVRPPSPSVFGEYMALAGLRSDLSGKNWKADIERTCFTDGLGIVLWPHAGLLTNPHLEECVQEMKRRGLFLFDVWGYVPTADRRLAVDSQFVVPRKTLDLFERELGDHWLGMDVGEQDGRYVGVESRDAYPDSGASFDRYLRFQRFFEKMGSDLGNRLSTLVSLNYGHYLLRDNNYALIGAETAQALPNGQVYYSFIRGAGKQYGVPWFGSVSIYNRWGFKSYTGKPPQPIKQGPRTYGATCGTSLALAKKLMYLHAFYNCVFTGMESSLYRSDGSGALSPLGRVQQEVGNWCRKNGNPGVQHVPVALMADAFSGWTFPRNFYKGGVTYRVWGSMPYGPGDYLMDGVFGMLYPGYQNAGYYHDESGFNVSTPYGDIADCLLSDAPLWLLRQYPLVILANRIEPSDETHDVLLAYVREGGHLVLTRGNERTLFPAGFGSLGKGRVSLIPSEWGVADSPQCALPVSLKIDGPLPTPYPLLDETKRVLDKAFREQMVFDKSDEPRDDGLSIVSCRRQKGEWTVCICNNAWEEKPFRIRSVVGQIRRLQELPVDASEREAEGFLPECVRTNGVFALGVDTERTIASGGVRMFRIWLDEEGAIASLRSGQPKPNVRNASLYLRGAETIKEQILARPTFFRHYDGVMVDWRALDSRDICELRGQRNWIDLQQLKVSVDLTSGCEPYLGMDLSATSSMDVAETCKRMKSLLEKMRAIGAKELVVALHRMPARSGLTKSVYEQGVVESFRRLARMAADDGVTVYLRGSPSRHITSSEELGRWTTAVGEPNFKSAGALALYLKRNFRDDVRAAKDLEAAASCPLYFLSACAKGGVGVSEPIHTVQQPLASEAAEPNPLRALKVLKKMGEETRVVYDAVYADKDAEYRDARLWESL